MSLEESWALYGRTEISEMFVANPEEYDLPLLDQNLFDRRQTNSLESVYWVSFKCLIGIQQVLILDRQKLDYSIQPLVFGDSSQNSQYSCVITSLFFFLRRKKEKRMKTFKWQLVRRSYFSPQKTSLLYFSGKFVLIQYSF